MKDSLSQQLVSFLPSDIVKDKNLSLLIFNSWHPSDLSDILKYLSITI